VKRSQITVLVLVAAATGVTWVIKTALVFRFGLHVSAFLVLLTFCLTAQTIYSRVRRRGKDAEFVGNWRVPGGAWILFGIVAVIFRLLVFLATREALNG